MQPGGGVKGLPMPQSLLQQLRAYTVIVADTGDLEAIARHAPRDATTNPSLITAAARMPAYAGIVDETLAAARRALPASAADGEVTTAAFERLAVAFGLEILSLIPGRVSTEVDARLSYDTAGTLAKARGIIARYEEAGVPRERVLIKIASTWEGIRAAERLEREGIHCNLTLLFGFHQAAACADAGVTLVSPFVGRILDWHLAQGGRESFAPADDPGVQSVTRIYEYYKTHGYATEVMGASFRNIGQITELAGCDLLTISPALLARLDTTEGELPRRLHPDKRRLRDLERCSPGRAEFERQHSADTMAREKLAEGIAGFTAALEALEALLGERLRTAGMAS